MSQSLQAIYKQQVAEAERRNREYWEQSLAKSQKALQSDPFAVNAYIEAAKSYSKLGRQKEAHEIIEQGLRCITAKESYQLHLWLIHLLTECNCTGQAVSAAEAAREIFPDDFLLKLLGALSLPVIYESTDELAEYRARYAAGLQKLSDELRLDTVEARENALSAFTHFSNYRLGYQAQNDRDLQSQYGRLLHQILAANFPERSHRIPLPDGSAGEKMRIGYVSSRFRNLSATKYFLGWLRGHNREAVSVYAYHAGPNTDSITEEVRKSSDVFRHIPDSFDQMCRSIAGDNLLVLVFLDVGLEAMTTRLAALRLAPIQCAAWDQPLTTGLPTIDYFLSSDATEPENGQEHYTEKLVRLPGIGVNYVKPVIPVKLLTKTRADFQLRENAVVYLCIQYAYKYLPGQDCLLVQIAQKVPHAQFVFLTENTFIAADLQSRLSRAFSAVNLVSSDYCVVLPALERFGYWNLSLVGDVFLDAIGWSGGVSTFEAIACGLPIVTLPGKFMRGRQSYAILRQLGVTDTIANDSFDFVRIAVRLGLDREFRKDVVQRMAANISAVYSDERSIPALETFYRRAIAQLLREGNQPSISGDQK